jgi:hypothetical protein
MRCLVGYKTPPDTAVPRQNVRRRRRRSRKRRARTPSPGRDQGLSAASLHEFVTANVAPDAAIKTDGWPSYTRPPTSSTSPMSSAPWPPMSFCPGSTAPSPRRDLGARRPHGLRRKHLQSYFDEFACRSIDSEPAMPPSAHFAQSPVRKPLAYNMLIMPEARR